MFNLNKTQVYNKNSDINLSENSSLLDKYRFVGDEERKAELKALYKKSLGDIFTKEREGVIGY